ncbi:uncharacterized protein LOC110623175 [Manihot esculenta]|uniref:uncharacterized protein LOC110623175 n=1 Tax=Manihot esculenta TaxID=3983 RepID=UPI001CC7CEEC|nr:uncharacterized protein LOC110623175 [Manihot esculenta]
MAEVISSKSASQPPPPPVSSQALRPSSRHSKSSRPSSRSRSSSAPQSTQAPRSPRAPTEGVKKVSRVASKSAESTELARTDPALPSVEVLEVRSEASVAEEGAPEKRMEVISTGEGAQEVSLKVVPTPEGTGPSPTDGGSVVEKVGAKRPAPTKVSTPVPVPKKSRASRRPAPTLPSLEKKKEAPVVPLLSAPDNDILSAEDITHQFPASVVAEIIKERMFGGVTEASDPRLLALTGLLASSTREQAVFRSRPREELGDTIREMLLMVMGLFMEVDARDHSLRESVDLRIEEARLEENLSATSDVRGNLAAAREHSRSLQIELRTALEALKRVDGRTTEAEEQRNKALKQLSSLKEIQRERDEALSQKEEVQRQHESLKTNFDVVLAQSEEALARAVVLEQELTKRANNENDLALAVETSKLQNQHLCQEVKVLKKRCAALLEDAKHAEDKIQLECEERLREYKESAELKGEIQQACEAHL